MSTAWSRHLRPSLEDLSVYDVPASTAAARLHANECPEPWPAEVRNALAQAIRSIELNRYPDTSGRSLRALLATHLGCAADRVVLGNGSDEIIALLLTALSGPRSGHLVIPVPTFVMYAHSARVLGMKVTQVPTREDLGLDEPGMRHALEGAAACFLARPNNPTSALWDAAIIERLIRDHPSTVFVIDEAYAAYAPGCSLWRPDGPDNSVHMSTLSKVGLAALRVGYCVAHPHLALALNKVRHPYNLSATSLILAETVLDQFGAVQAEMIDRVVRNRARLCSILATVPEATVHPAHGNLVLVSLPSPARAREIQQRCRAAGVLVKGLDSVPGFEHCLRVSVGTRTELDHLERALAT